VLYFDCAAHRVNDATELDDAAIAGAFDDPSAMHRDCGIDQIAAQRPQPSENPLLIRFGEPAIADHIRD
jgi:hypothetical protein